MKRLFVFPALFLFLLIGFSASDADIQKRLDAAAQGQAEAQNILGMMYDQGFSVLQNYKTAAKWYRMAGNGTSRPLCLPAQTSVAEDTTAIGRRQGVHRLDFGRFRTLREHARSPGRRPCLTHRRY